MVIFLNNTSISLGKRQLVDSIWKSAGIEGLGTTFPNTEKILENLPVETKTEEVLFIVNMKRAWNFVFDTIDYPLNLSYLREINKICMDNISYNSGSIRNVPVTIGGTTWTPEMPFEGNIIDDLSRIISTENIIDRALDIFCYTARTQMFLDGNKRVAQLSCNKILMQNDMGIFSVPYDQIDKFKELLVQFYESNNSNNLKAFFKSSCLLLTNEGRSILASSEQNCVRFPNCR